MRRADKSERKAKKLLKEDKNDGDYNVNKDLYEKAKPVEFKKKVKKESIKNKVN
jgi:hypothetical protein